ncbi:MAG: DUF1566 domain-containing protein [Chloroflexi bacterium]|nr:DUF1566 domain-containing protein [Chloroflexota bacterium]
MQRVTPILQRACRMDWQSRLPGLLASALALVSTGFWWYWGMGEMYFEGWWGAWYNRLPYLIPGTACLLIALVAVTWPRTGGGLALLAWVGFTIFSVLVGLRNMFVYLTLGGALFLIAVLFWLEGRRRRTWIPPLHWWQRHATLLLIVGMCLVITVGVSTYYLPVVLTREDDGYRGTSLIRGNGVTLMWAPEGPGWNWLQDYGGYPSWKMLALYGLEPIGLDDKNDLDRTVSAGDMAQTGLCAYLNADGTELMDTPQDIWRMPTTEEVVHSLVRHGENAGCAWDGDTGMMDCDRLPDKETPLWTPDTAPVYYWTADVDPDDADFAYYVAYNGAVQTTINRGGNPRHGYRCVKEPPPDTGEFPTGG